jgi:hypothetical protein
MERAGSYSPSCASGFMVLTWMVREPYPTGGEDLQLQRLIPIGGGRTETFASGSSGSVELAYCEEIYLFNNSLQDYRVEIRHASGIQENSSVPTLAPGGPLPTSTGIPGGPLPTPTRGP